jgi:hypothetical protein
MTRNNTIQMQREYLPTLQGPDWFDDNHDSMLILQSRDSEENGASPQSEVLGRSKINDTGIRIIR